MEQYASKDDKDDDDNDNASFESSLGGEEVEEEEEEVDDYEGPIVDNENDGQQRGRQASFSDESLDLTSDDYDDESSDDDDDDESSDDDDGRPRKSTAALESNGLAVAVVGDDTTTELISSPPARGRLTTRRSSDRINKQGRVSSPEMTRKFLKKNQRSLNKLRESGSGSMGRSISEPAFKSPLISRLSRASRKDMMKTQSPESSALGMGANSLRRNAAWDTTTTTTTTTTTKKTTTSASAKDDLSSRLANLGML